MSSSKSSSPTVPSPASPHRAADNQADKRKAPQAVILDSTSPSPTTEKRTRGCSSKTPQEPQHLRSNQHMSETPNPQAEDLAMPNEVANNVAASTADAKKGNPINAAMTIKIGRYELNSKYVDIFRGILNKHGDIARHCHPTSTFMLNTAIEAICKILIDLQCKRLSDLEQCDFFAYSSILKNAEEMGMNVKWLQHRLQELQEASRALVQDNTLEHDRGERMMRLDYLKQALHVKKGESEKIKSEIKQLELQVDIERTAIEDVKL